MLTVIRTFDQPPQFLPGLADSAVKGFGKTLAINTPTQPPTIRTARVNTAVAMIASVHHKPLALILARASSLLAASGRIPGRNSQSSAGGIGSSFGRTFISDVSMVVLRLPVAGSVPRL
jgi:hypothetical protein